MSMPSPFELGRGITQNALGAVQESREHSALDDILSQAMKSGNEQDYNNLIQQILTKVSPERQAAAINVIKGRQEQILNKKTQSEMQNIADQIQTANPDSSYHKMIASIYRSDIPVANKEKLLASISKFDPFKAEQQMRLEFDSRLKHYNARIKEFDTQIKNTRYSERKQLQLQRDALANERDEIAGYKELFANIKNTKVKFDPTNEKHKQRFNELKTKYNNDKEKVNKAMAEEFSL